MERRNDIDALFKKIADSYVETYGESLQEEMAHVEITRISPGLDARVKANVQRVKRMRNTRIFGLVAACLVVVVMAPAIYTQVTRNAPAAETAAVMDQAKDAELSQAMQAQEKPESAEEEAIAPEAEAPAMDAAAGEAAAADEAAQTDEGMEYELIPLNATLPENFSVSAMDQDKAKTIYYLDNTKLDDAVLTLERTDSMPDVSGFKEYTINGKPAYGTYQPDYSVLIFEKDGVLYELTCEHDLNTLLELGEAIL